MGKLAACKFSHCCKKSSGAKAVTLITFFIADLEAGGQGQDIALHVLFVQVVVELLLVFAVLIVLVVVVFVVVEVATEVLLGDLELGLSYVLHKRVHKALLGCGSLCCVKSQHRY